jgi:hypothetical protein
MAEVDEMGDEGRKGKVGMYVPSLVADLEFSKQANFPLFN